MDHDQKRRDFRSLLECWRPRRDLNPCYRRERTTPLSKYNDLEEAGGTVSPCWSVQARLLPYRNPYRDFRIIHTALRLPPVKVACTYTGPIVSTSSIKPQSISTTFSGLSASRAAFALQGRVSRTRARSTYSRSGRASTRRICTDALPKTASRLESYAGYSVL